MPLILRKCSIAVVVGCDKPPSYYVSSERGVKVSRSRHKIYPPVRNYEQAGFNFLYSKTTNQKLSEKFIFCIQCPFIIVVVIRIQFFLKIDANVLKANIYIANENTHIDSVVK